MIHGPKASEYSKKQRTASINKDILDKYLKLSKERKERGLEYKKSTDIDKDAVEVRKGLRAELKDLKSKYSKGELADGTHPLVLQFLKNSSQGATLDTGIVKLMKGIHDKQRSGTELTGPENTVLDIVNTLKVRKESTPGDKIFVKYWDNIDKMTAQASEISEAKAFNKEFRKAKSEYNKEIERSEKEHFTGLGKERHANEYLTSEGTGLSITGQGATNSYILQFDKSSTPGKIRAVVRYTYNPLTGKDAKDAGWADTHKVDRDHKPALVREFDASENENDIKNWVIESLLGRTGTDRAAGYTYASQEGFGKNSLAKIVNKNIGNVIKALQRVNEKSGKTTNPVTKVLNIVYNNGGVIDTDGKIWGSKEVALDNGVAEEDLKTREQIESNLDKYAEVKRAARAAGFKREGKGVHTEVDVNGKRKAIEDLTDSEKSEVLDENGNVKEGVKSFTVNTLTPDSKSVVSGKHGAQITTNFNAPKNRKSGVHSIAEAKAKGIDPFSINTSRDTRGNLDWKDKKKTRKAEDYQKREYSGELTAEEQAKEQEKEQGGVRIAPGIFEAMKAGIRL